jgi:hypothetical protein
VKEDLIERKCLQYQMDHHQQTLTVSEVKEMPSEEKRDDNTAASVMLARLTLMYRERREAKGDGALGEGELTL